MMGATIRAFTVLSSMAIVLTSLLSGCSGGDGETAAPSSAAFTSPLAVSLAWDPVPDSSLTGYVIHYGTSSPNASGSCNYEHALFVPSPQGTVINLHPETRYYFSVSSYNGTESACSSEVSTVTPPLPT
jgi:Fibronectin type III domain